MQNPARLLVWQKAHTLALTIHRLTDRLARRDNSGFVSQIRRASHSIPANIAEGASRATDRDFARFIQIAVGSATEVEYHLKFASELGLLTAADCECCTSQVVEVRKMMFGLLRRLKDPTQRGRSANTEAVS